MATHTLLDRLWRRDRILVALMVAAGLLGLVYNGVMLLGFGPDEPRHMAYVKLLLDEHRLPFQLPDGSEYAGAHTFHPPLYYLVLAPFYAVARALAGEAGWHLVRAVSMALGVAALPLIYDLALRAGDDDKNLARLAVAQVGLLPMFGMTAGTVNNDSAALLAITLFLWLLAVRYPHDRSLRAAALLGVCLGLGALCKATALLCDGVAFLLYLLAQDGRAAWRSGRNWARLGLFGLTGALIAGPWHLRSLKLYHTWTPLPPAMPTPALPSPDHGILVMMLHDNFPPVFALANWGIFSTLWSQKDWIPESVRRGVYPALAAYCLLAVAGLVARRSKVEATAADASDDGVARRIALWCPIGAFVASWLTVLQVALFMHWGWAEGGRYLLPSFAGCSILLALGWQRWLGTARLKTLLAIWCAALLALNALAVYWLLSYLNPTYGPR